MSVRAASSGDDFSSASDDEELVFLPALREPMTPEQREAAVEALAALLIDYWEENAYEPVSVSHPRGNVGRPDPIEEVGG